MSDPITTPRPWRYEDGEIVAGTADRAKGEHVVCLGHDYDDCGELDAANAALIIEAVNAFDDDARHLGYREGRAAVWREVKDWAKENLDVAERVLGHRLVTSDDVRGILSESHDDR